MTAPATSPTGLLPARAVYEPIATAVATPSTAIASSSVLVIQPLLFKAYVILYNDLRPPVVTAIRPGEAPLSSSMRVAAQAYRPICEAGGGRPGPPPPARGRF